MSSSHHDNPFIMQIMVQTMCWLASRSTKAKAGGGSGIRTRHPTIDESRMAPSYPHSAVRMYT